MRNTSTPAVLILTVMVLALTGCAGSKTSSESTATVVESDDSWLPFGFEESTTGIGFRWAPVPSRVDCPQYAPSCFGVEVATNISCSNGVYIELALVDSTGTIRGKANEISAAMQPGDKAALAIVGAQESPQAKLTQLSCL